MNKTPYFSIVMPVYNVASYLRETLDSVLNQTFTDWECICIDDGSPDESGAILDEYAERDKRFRIVHQENTHVATVRNRGLKMAGGEYIWFVDGDDVISCDALQCIYDDIHVEHPDVSRIGWWEFGSGERKDFIPFRKGYVDVVAYVENDLMTAMPPVHVLARKFLIENEICFPDGLVYEDMEWSAHLMHNAERFFLIPRAIYGYRRGIASATQKPVSLRYVSSFARMCSTINERILPHEKRSQIREHLRNWSETMGWNVFQYYWRFKLSKQDDMCYRKVVLTWRRSPRRVRKFVYLLSRLFPLKFTSFVMWSYYRLKP